MTLTQTQVEDILLDVPTERAASVICGLVGHSRVCARCMGYRYCARCDAQLGDALGGVDPDAENAVLLDHGCDTCREVAKTLNWTDTLGLPEAALEYLEALEETNR